MNQITKASLATASTQTVIMAAIFVRSSQIETFLPFLLVSALAHWTIFALFTRELATLVLKQKYKRLIVEVAIAVIFALICVVQGIKLQIQLRNGVIIPNGDIASFALIVVAISIVVTIICFFTFVANSDEAMAEIRGDLETERLPLT